MAGGKANEPTRDEVFAFVDANPGAQGAAIVAHFAAQGRHIAGGKVRTWLSRRRQAHEARAAAAVALSGATPEIRAAVAGENVVATVFGGDGGGTRSGTTSGSRTRDSEHVQKPTLRLAPHIKSNLRDCAEGLSAFLGTARDTAVEVEVIKANPKGDGGTLRVLDMQQYLHAAKALSQILDIAKGTDAFEADTGGNEAPTDANPEAERLAEAFGIDLDGPG